MYADQNDGLARFNWISSPTNRDLIQLAQTIARRVGRYLERRGLLRQDAENSYLATKAVSEGLMDQLSGNSITYRIAVGPQAGPNVYTLQTLPACDPENRKGDTVAKCPTFPACKDSDTKALE